MRLFFCKNSTEIGTSLEKEWNQKRDFWDGKVTTRLYTDGNISLDRENWYPWEQKERRIWYTSEGWP